jgi:hypothetical protein
MYIGTSSMKTYPLIENLTFWKNWYSRNSENIYISRDRQELSTNYWRRKNCKIKNWRGGWGNVRIVISTSSITTSTFGRPSLFRNASYADIFIYRVGQITNENNMWTKMRVNRGRRTRPCTAVTAIGYARSGRTRGRGMCSYAKIVTPYRDDVVGRERA